MCRRLRSSQLAGTSASQLTHHLDSADVAAVFQVLDELPLQAPGALDEGGPRRRHHAEVVRQGEAADDRADVLVNRQPIPERRVDAELLGLAPERGDVAE